MGLTKIGPKHQITIPKAVFDRLDLEVGDYLDVAVQGTMITMAPKKLISKDQAWFHTPEWQRQEREADEAIGRGDISGPFSSAEELIKHLRKKRKRGKR